MPDPTPMTVFCGDAAERLDSGTAMIGTASANILKSTGSSAPASFVVPLYKHRIDILPMVNEAIETQVDDCVTSMRNTIRKTEGVEMMILTGGGAELYYPHIVKRFPEHDVVMLENPVMGNAEGY